MADEKLIMFRNRLEKVFRYLSRQAKRSNVSCFRIYDHDLPEFPFCIEKYENKFYVAEYQRRHGLDEDEHSRWLKKSEEVMCQVFGIVPDDIFLKLRKVKEGRFAQYRKVGEGKSEFIVSESDLKFIVNLSDYLDTGLFLDHRITRQMIRDESAGKKVLNLFCYTGSFSVYAAAGGAAEVVSLDLSKTYLEWARRNLELNGFNDLSKYKYVHADAMKYIQVPGKPHFDIVILDPPTFSNSQRMDDFLDIQRDHVALINDCLKCLEPGGSIYFSTNARKFQLRSDELFAKSIVDITKRTTPFDFTGRLFRVCYRIGN